MRSPSDAQAGMEHRAPVIHQSAARPANLSAPMPQPAAAAPPPAPQSSDWTSKLAVLLATLRGQLAPAAFAQVEQLVMDTQSQRVQLTREQFLQQIQAITQG